ncbi:hypothetical protein Teth39_2049 [Thermoanaerobacter pseudethanolicus ATCC 33223]|uniref:DUF6431 domain-containing protein n=3 Tax=Thermoanaerobacter TaxID=1754 RepID=B0KCP8_THEP3|nr:hypothetical protein Teth39_1871 [Thermoanaerobacter pseudethanolicus ATCC 33223]ABY95673.1 hypothetical protein Teth39_2049 [Thermoanaerobacter pseudethanolicus ATCC 33223]
MERLLMQIVFHVDNIEEYLRKGKDYNFPAPPDRCPYPDCKCRVKLKKHGFYYRYYLDGSNCIKIAIRRYICPVCKRTLSYLPDFCLPHFQYSFNMIVKSLKETLTREKTLSSFISDLKRNFPTILFSRQHIYFYTKRIMNNLSFIIYGLRQIDPYIKLSETDSQRERAREILDIISIVPLFSQRFYAHCQKSFLASLT